MSCGIAKSRRLQPAKGPRSSIIQCRCCMPPTHSMTCKRLAHGRTVFPCNVAFRSASQLQSNGRHFGPVVPPLLELLLPMGYSEDPISALPTHHLSPSFYPAPLRYSSSAYKSNKPSFLRLRVIPPTVLREDQQNPCPTYSRSKPLLSSSFRSLIRHGRFCYAWHSKSTLTPRCQLPLALVQATQGKPMMVELKNGET